MSMEPDPAGAPRLSVVIPVRDGATTIGQQLEALAAQTYDEPWEVVVADNGSTDGTADVVGQHRAHLPRLRVVSADGGVGINFARNAGVRHATGELVLICDADDMVHPGWVRAHARALEHYDLSGGPLDLATLNSAEVAALHADTVQDRCPTTGRFLPYATGCNFGFRREVWEDLGGFDDAWRRGHTETEFCWRAQIAGFTLGWASEAVVAYRRSSSLKGDLKRLFRSARALPRLYRAFRAYGMPRSRLGRALRAWLWLGYRIPWALLDREWRVKWLQVGAWRAGLVAGSIRYGVRYL